MMENLTAQITENIKITIYDKENEQCKGIVSFAKEELEIDGFKIRIADNGGIQVFMPKEYGTTWPYSDMISWKELQKSFKMLFLDKHVLSEENNNIDIELGDLQNDRSCNVMACFTDGTAVTGIRVLPLKTGGLHIVMPDAFGSVWPFDEYISWKDIQILIKNKYFTQYPIESKKGRYPKVVNATDISVKFYNIDRHGTCYANCIFKNENIEINNFILHFSNVQITVDKPNGLEEWPVKSISWDDFKIFLIEKLKRFFYKMNIDYKKLNESTNSKNDEIWVNKGSRMVDIPKDSEKSAPDFNWRALLGEHNSISGMSPLIFVPNTVLRLEEYIEKHEQIKSNKKNNKKGNDSKANIPVDFLVSALSHDDFIGSFEVDVLMWINRLRYVTTAMLMDLYISGYIAPTWRKVTKDKFAKIINRMQKYNLVNVTRFAAFDDISQNFDSKALNRIYTLGKNGNILLRQLGRESTYSAFDIYQDGNVVKGYMAANQHLIRWLSSFPYEIKNNYETNHVVYSLGPKGTGARLGCLVRCGKGTVIIESVRRSDRWTYDENCLFFRDKLTRIIELINNHDNLYHRSIFGGSEVKYELNEDPVICYTCEDEEHMRETWEIIKPIAIANPDQRIWFTHDLNIYNDNAEGKRYIEFSEDDTCSIVDMQKLFGLGKERDYDFLYNN